MNNAPPPQFCTYMEYMHDLSHWWRMAIRLDIPDGPCFLVEAVLGGMLLPVTVAC